MSDNNTFKEKKDPTEEKSLEISKLETNPTISNNSSQNPSLEITSKEGFFPKLIRRLFQTVSSKESIINNKGKSNPINFISNQIDNQKYNIFTLLPLFFFNEYKHFSNFYFLLIALTQIYEPFRIGFLITYIGPIILVAGLSLIKELWDEIKRKLKDKKLNKEIYIKITDNGQKEIFSENLKVGDFLVLQKDQRVPADMILLQTKDVSGTAFVRTDQLDGETDWKVREAIKQTQKYGNISPQEILKENWKLKVEAPSDLIYDFKGGFYDKDNNFTSLKLKNTIWASMKVASGEVIGMIIYCGKETRIAQNSSSVNKKYGKTDSEFNFLIKILFGILFFISFLMLFLSGQFMTWNWYIYTVKIFVLFSSVIPISMKVNVDFAKLYFSLLINKDKGIEGTICRNSGIPEELGRIQYLLSDKTGTLTRNEMIFKHLRTLVGNYCQDNFILMEKMLINSYKRLHGEEKVDEKENPLKIKNDDNKEDNEFVLVNVFSCFLLCNNVSPIIDKGERILQASSPDEVALVNFAETVGFKLLERKTNLIKIKTPGDFIEEYEILFNFPFSSETKRMGIILRNLKTNKITFFLKGADIVMQKKVSLSEKMFIEEEAGDLSKDGLRTLVLASKEITEEELNTFTEEMKIAGKDLTKRNDNERKCINNFESKMKFLCVTGVEDLLQEDIKNVILNLRDAGIKVWMLTGDKLETAKCIAISTGFKKNNQNFFEISSTSKKEILDKIYKFKLNKEVLLVTGKTLEVIFKDKPLLEQFFEYAKDASSVVLCRCAPKQKALVTTYIKNSLNKIVCGIGDGGNDVGMIQCANIGIGIEGKEGLQASLASDVSVIKFKNILKLIIWHGRLSYVRSSVMANFIIHRGLIITVIQMFFIITFYFSSISIYNGYLIMGYSTIFTNFPVFALILDIDIPIEQAFNYPMLYSLTQEGRNISPKVFFIWLWKSIFQGSVIILLTLYLFNNSFIEIVTITFTALIIIEFLNMYSIIRMWHSYMIISIVLSAGLYGFCLLFLQEMFLLSPMNQETFLKILFLSLCAWIPLQLFQTLKRMLFPSQVDKVIREAKIQNERINQEHKYKDKLFLN